MIRSREALNPNSDTHRRVARSDQDARLRHRHRWRVPLLDHRQHLPAQGLDTGLKRLRVCLPALLDCGCSGVTHEDCCALAHVCVVATVERLYSKTVSAGGLVDPCYFLIDQTTHTAWRVCSVNTVDSQYSFRTLPGPSGLPHSCSPHFCSCSGRIPHQIYVDRVLLAMLTMSVPGS